MTDIEQREPVAAYTVDLTGCEHLSRDVANIERIAAAGSEGPTAVHPLYTGQQLAEVERAAARATAEKTGLLQAIEHHTGFDHGIMGIRSLVDRATTAEAEAERLRALVEEAKAALWPFADVADFMDSETEGFGVEDNLSLVVQSNEFPDFQVRDFTLQTFFAARDLRDRLGVEG